MNWNEVTIYTTTNGLEILNGALMSLGINDAVIEDAGVFRDFLEDKTMNWDYYDENVSAMQNCESCIKVYLADNEQGNRLLCQVGSMLEGIKNQMEGIDMGRLTMVLRTVCDEDWANNWKQYFKPFEVGSKIVIKPTWENYESDDSKIILEIDPGASFGTGQHNTTRLCIEQMEKYIASEMKVLDMGCGSGILSIAAMLLNADSCTAVDIDETAVRIAGENASVNNIENGRIRFLCGNVTDDENLQQDIGFGCYDMIVVNIMADIIIGMSYCFPKFLKKGGIIIASGIIERYVDKVSARLKELGFDLLEVNKSEDWVSITAQLM